MKVAQTEQKKAEFEQRTETEFLMEWKKGGTMERRIVSTDKAPAAIGPYSQAVIAGNLLFISGQVALVPGDPSKKLNNPDIKTETRQVLENIKGVVEAAGSSLANAVKMTVFMKDINNYGAINEVYNEYFSESKPARAAVAVAALPLDAGVEIEGVFIVPE